MTENTNNAKHNPHLGALVLGAVDHAIATRYDRAIARSRTLRDANPNMSDRALARRTCSRYTHDIAAAGALSGAAAAVPGAGVPVGLAAMVPEMAYFTFRTVDVILTTAALSGYDLEDIEERRFVVLGMLAGTDAWAGAVTPVVGNAARGLGAQAVKKIPVQSLRAINKALGRQVLVKYGTKQGGIRLGRVAPLGIGIAIGGSVNYLFARSISTATLAFFRSDPGDPMPAYAA